MAEEEKKEQKKIIIDEDWKKEVKKEKDIEAQKKQAEKEKTEKEKKARGPLPKGDFAALISMLTTQVFFALGMIQPEGQEKKEPDLEMARYNIGMLETLQEKTEGNLAEQEEKVLKDTLNQIRMAYVKIAE